MHLFAIGLSHQTAPVEIREQLALRSEDYPDRLRSLLEDTGAEEAILLATCNRMEIYCKGEKLDSASLLNWIHEAWTLRSSRLDKYFYVYRDSDAVRHLIRVAGGMDSLVLGETQILGQLKEAWATAREAGTTGVVIDRLCQHAVASAKSIRHQSGIGDMPVSVAYTALTLARQLFSDLESKQVLLIGAGEMIALCGQHLKQHGVSRIVIANRDLARAKKLANEVGATPIALSQLEDMLPHADILISSTASAEPVLTVESVRSALDRRRHRPMFIVDIAVPRDVEPAVAKLRDVYVYTIDDLQQVVDENLEQRSKAAAAAEQDVDIAAEEFIRWMNGSQASDTLQLMRNAAHEHSRELVERALKRLEAGHDPKDVLEQLGSTLANRILHAPVKQLRQAAENKELEILAAINQVFSPLEDQALPNGGGGDEAEDDAAEMESDKTGKTE